MKQRNTFHILTVGWGPDLIDRICNRVAARSEHRFTHIVHPDYVPGDWPRELTQPDIYFFRDDLRQRMPAPDHKLLASLEMDSVPTVHNMIMSDRIVSKVRYVDALGYATFLAQRLFELFGTIKPDVIIGGFDGIHCSIALAVARQMNIPWYVLNFSTIPAGLACFCDKMTPAARVSLNKRSFRDLQNLAENSLQQFEKKKIHAPTYIAPPPLSVSGKILSLPRRLSAAHRSIQKSRLRRYIQFTQSRTDYSISAVLTQYQRTGNARRALLKIETLTEPLAVPYVFFGLQMQPESSIDVWAPFFSNQMWVIELLSRSIPPTHKLLVKFHKSDISNYSREQLEKMKAFPGVELVAPFTDTRNFIQNADLIIAIQSTIGLEAALLGKPVIMLDESPITLFPSASGIGEIADLPILIRNKLSELTPSREEILKGYASYLDPFYPASPNDWTAPIGEEQIANYVNLFNNLKRYILDVQND
jgi:hypothetical protein